MGEQEEEGQVWEAGLRGLGAGEMAEGGLRPSRRGYIEPRAVGKCSLSGERS